jgi:hypothetical protein
MQMCSFCTRDDFAAPEGRIFVDQLSLELDYGAQTLTKSTMVCNFLHHEAQKGDIIDVSDR